MKSRIKEQLSPIENFAVDVIEEEFEKLSKNCEYRFLDDKNRANCNYHDSSVGLCRAQFCPKLHGKEKAEEEDGNGTEKWNSESR